MRLVPMVLVLATMSPVDATAQFTSVQCDTIAARVVVNPTVDTLLTLEACNEQVGPALATLLSNYSLIADTNRYLFVYEVATRRRHPDVFAAANTIALDGSAPMLARMVALATLVRYESTRIQFDLKALQSYSGSTSSCFPLPTLRTLQPGHTELPSGHKATAHNTALAIAGSGAATPLKFLANCLEAITEPIAPPGQISVPDATVNWPSDFSFIAECGRKILVRNKTYVPVSVVLDDRKFTLPAREVGSAYSETEWTVPGTSSTTQVDRLGTLLRNWLTIPVNSTPC